METTLSIARQFIDDPDGIYMYLGELEHGKHFVEYMFSDDCMDGDVALRVGGPQYLVVTDGQCRYAYNDECEIAMKHVAESTEDA